MCDTVYICRHGETEWTKSGQHTGTTDLPLTEKGEKQAESLKTRLSKSQFDHVLCSPLQRVKRTCELAGYTSCVINNDLVEWNYGEYEGITTPEIHQTNPGWNVFLHGAPGGESVEMVGARADRVVETLHALEGTVLLFTSGHFCRVLTMRWLDLAVPYGRFLDISTASLSIVGYSRGEPIINQWNEVLNS